MKTRLIILFHVLWLYSFCYGQGRSLGGMHFETGVSWKAILAKAKQENKLVFLDCYTTWCAPCKIMSDHIFPLKEIGAFYNAHFINTKVQMDSSANDDQFIKSWYSDAHEIATKYQVTSYPTYLIFNGDGEILHRFSGSMPAETFVEKGKQVLEPQNWYYPQLRDYEKGDRTPEKIMQLGKLAREVGHDEKANELFNEYLKLQPDIFTKEHLLLLYEVTSSSADWGFKIALDSAEVADRILGKVDASNDLVEDILVQETMRKIVESTGKPDFTAIRKKLQDGYPRFADYVSSYAMMRYYRDIEEWDTFVEHADKAIQHKKYKLSNYAIRNNAEMALKNVNDKKLLGKALRWMEFVVNKKEVHLRDMHTYANILYKLGSIKEAINEEKLIIETAKQTKGDITLYENALRKMEKGEPTW